ncbi:hypothetical protein OIU78_004731 [Salix suchowensis]|nr:hypothetical protein OIU78_004731 [Salix suchowensis]
MLQRSHDQDDHHQPPTSLNPILPSCAPHDFYGVASFLGKRSSMSFSGIDVCHEEGNGEDELSDDGSQAGEKKRRLNMEQVKTLEKNFERARWKTKQLEKDYDLLKRQFDAIKAENDALQAQNQKLHAEILALKSREPTEPINLNRETERCSSENSSDMIKFDVSRTPAIDSPLSNRHPTSIALSPSSSSIRPTGVAQLFQTIPSRPDVQCQKIDQLVKEENLGTMFCSIEDQSGFWPWLEHQHFN